MPSFFFQDEEEDDDEPDSTDSEELIPTNRDGGRAGSAPLRGSNATPAARDRRGPAQGGASSSPGHGDGAPSASPAATTTPASNSRRRETTSFGRPSVERPAAASSFNAVENGPSGVNQRDDDDDDGDLADPEHTPEEATEQFLDWIGKQFATRVLIYILVNYMADHVSIPLSIIFCFGYNMYNSIIVPEPMQRTHSESNM